MSAKKPIFDPDWDIASSVLIATFSNLLVSRIGIKSGTSLNFSHIVQFILS